MNFVTEFLFPTFYTTIGAVIGGLIAYLIAKRNFSINRRDEGKAYVSLLNIYANAIAAKCNVAHEFLASWNPTPDNLNKIALLKEKCRLLKNETSYFAKYWSKYKETIQHCRLKSVCKNNNQREQYAHIVESCESVCAWIATINTYLDEMRRDHNKKSTSDDLSTEIMQKAKNAKDALLPLLESLKDECAKLNEPVSKLGI